MTKTTKIATFTTDDLEVQWGHLHELDTKFGVNSANHNVSVYISEGLQQEMDRLLKETGASKINGVREEKTKEGELTGRRTLKAKTVLFRDLGGPFQCVDAKNAKTDAQPYGGDTVRLILAPVLQARDNSLSLYLNACQIVNKKEFLPNAPASDFAPVEGGFDGSEYEAPSASVEDEDIPF